MCKTFSLKKACKDCPFKKGNSYLHPEALKMRIDQVTKKDQSFSCHKTVDYDVYTDYQEALDLVDEMRNDRCNESKIKEEREKLENELNFLDLSNRYMQSQNNEMYCAGMLILVKKEGMIFNNFPLRYAVGTGLLDLEQFKNEDQVYDSIADAISAHYLNNMG